MARDVLKLFVRKLFWEPWIFRTSRQNVCFCLGFEEHTKLPDPHPFTWRTPTPPQAAPTQHFIFVLFFFPDLSSPRRECPNKTVQSRFDLVPTIRREPREDPAESIWGHSQQIQAFLLDSLGKRPIPISALLPIRNGPFLSY